MMHGHKNIKLMYEYVVIKEPRSGRISTLQRSIFLIYSGRIIPKSIPTGMRLIWSICLIRGKGML